MLQRPAPYEPQIRPLSDNIALRRTQSRLNQRRYRAQKRHALEDREREVAELHNQIARYEGQLDILRSAIRLHEPEVQVANEYFRIFQHSSQKSMPSYGQYQCDFLRSVMQPDVRFMGQIGIQKLFEQWTLYHSLFHSFEMRCPRLEVIKLADAAIVRAPAVMHLRISRTTIECLYPHVLSNERIVQKLVGQVMHLPILIHFHYDASGHIEELETVANMTASLEELLRDVDDTLLVLNGARMKGNAELVSSTTPCP